ncbi:MAG: hypothetical protein KKE23_03030 [Nanoarchaeota archaeon]|nr:hypothetical protein [Nanoarchaeota archaeon]
MVISKVRKRDGSIEDFNSLSIAAAIMKAMVAVEEKSLSGPKILTNQIVKELNEKQNSFFEGIPPIEQIQDKVEEVLSQSKFQRTAKAYMLYRRSRKNARELKRFFGIKDDLKFDTNAIRVLQERYLLRNKDGQIIETPTQLFRRVAKAIASIEKTHERKAEYEKRFFSMMSNLEFLPNSPTLMNAGIKNGQLSACFVLPIEDSLKSIFTTLENAALIQQIGGGTGFNFSHIRPKGDIVNSTKGIACFSGDTRIMTNKGMLTVSEIVSSNRQLFAWTHKGWKKIINKFDNGKAQTYSLVTKEGYNVEVTAGHKFLTFDEEGKFILKSLAELKINDYVLVLPQLDNNKSIKNIELNTNIIGRSCCKLSILPSTLDEDLAYLIGLSFADGHIVKGHSQYLEITLNSRDDKLILEKVLSILNKYAIKPSIYKRPEVGRIDIRIGYTLFIRFLAKNGLLKQKAIDIASPEMLFKSPQEVISSFIAGFFDGDGCAGKDGRISIKTISKKMVQDIQLLLLKLGIPSCINESAPNSRSPHTGYRLCIYADSYKKYFIEKTRKHSVKLSSKKIISFKNRKWSYPFNPIYHIKNPSIRAIISKSIVPYNCNVTSRKCIQRLLSNSNLESDEKGYFSMLNHMVPSQIKQIIPSGVKNVFDLEVEDIHLLTGNGIYTSNSGPVSFMKIYDETTETIKQGGKRRGANMGILHVGHPDILEFITVKQKQKQMNNFNISVGVDDKFMQAVLKNKDYNLINPRTGKIVEKINARLLFDLICNSAWKTGDPGIVFLDEINRKNQVPELGRIESTNPCVSKDTWIMTSKGPRQVNDLIGNKTEVMVDGKKWSDHRNGFFSTGIKQLLKLETNEGFEISLTGNHPIRTVTKLTRDVLDTEWKKTEELKSGDKIIMNNHQNLKWKGKFGEKEGYLIGSLIGDGTITNDKILLYSWGESEGEKRVRALIKKYAMEFAHRSDFKGWQYRPKDVRYSLSMAHFRRLAKELNFNKDKVIASEIEMASYEFYIGFIKGFFDTDGSVQGDQKKGASIRLAQSDIERLKAVQRMLLRLGIYSKIYQNRRKEGMKELPDGKGGKKMYPIKSQHELIISNDNLLKYYEKIGFENSDKMDKLRAIVKKYKRNPNKERFIATIKSLAPIKKEEVYDIQIPGINAFDANGFYVHNCGEAALFPYESCNLGSINLTKVVNKKKINWNKLELLVRDSVRFLDNVIDANVYPFKELEKMTKGNRRIGLGVMGFAEMLILLDIPYESKKSLKIASRLMKFINKIAHSESAILGNERGNFPNFDKSIWKRKTKSMRNCALTTIAPTGTISIIAGCSSGIEPLFAIAFMREVLSGKHLFEVNKIFEKKVIEEKFHSDNLMKKIAISGNLRRMNVPKRIKKLFKTALEISPEHHIKVQAAFQKYTDNAVSKTINLSKNATEMDVKDAYLLAFKSKCKGITIYRYGSKPEQVLYLGKGKKMTHAEMEFTGGTCIGKVCSF